MVPDSKSSFRVEIRDERHVRVLECHGALTFGPAETAIERRITAAIDDGLKSIVIDLTSVDHVDSAGIGALVQAVRSCERHNSIVKLVVSPNSRVQQTLAVTQLDRVFEIFATAARAVTSF